MPYETAAGALLRAPTTYPKPARVAQPGTTMAKRRFPIGAELVAGGTHFRVWAPARKRVAVVIGGDEHPLVREKGGYFSGSVRGIGAGTRYRLRLDGARKTLADPASRFQPDGPHGDSAVVDPSAYAWSSDHRRIVAIKGMVISEIHIGTFTPEGTWAAAAAKLPLLADAGINMIEVMPVADFAGSFGWGYDGVDLWAPSHLYGTPDDFRRFVDAAHASGLSVILDVVYNHLGPDGSYLSEFAPGYFTKRYENEWGDAINFDGDDSAGVREFFVENAACWIEEFRLDGLRLDATQSIHDSSEPHILAAIATRAREAAGGRSIFLVAENEPQDVRLLTEYGLDAMWNDDWHHSARVALTGKTEAYYTDYRGRPQEFVSMAKYGFLFQGQRYSWQKNRRGTPSIGLAAERFVCSIENHDQVANSAHGERAIDITSPARLRAMTALLLLGPQTPMLFQGQEFGSSKPFLYFADHHPKLAAAVRKGRHEFLAQFPSIAAIAKSLAAPEERSTFEACRLDWSERDQNAGILALHRDLIAIRRSDPTFARQDAAAIDGAVLGDSAFIFRWLTGGLLDRLLVINLGRALHLDPAPEPLLAPPFGTRWRMRWSSEAVEYGGGGTAELEGEENWRIPAEAAVVMVPEKL